MALWTPANLAVPPRVWWNGDTAVFSGSNLSSWANSGSEGGSATIGGTPTQATLNSLNGVTFDAAGEKLSLTVGAWGSSGVMQFFDVSDPIAFASGLEGIMHRGSPATTSGLTVNVGVEIYIAAQGFASAPIAHATAGMANTNPYLLFGSVGTTQAIYVNGTAETLDGDTAGGTFPNLASATWDFGEGWDPVNQNGANYQRLVFDYALSTDERQKLEGWAAWKYGLQASLPGGHPYASAAPTVAATGSASITEAADTTTAAGTVRVSGASSYTEAADTTTAAGTVRVLGAASITEAADTVTATGGATSGLNGSANITEAADTVSSAGRVRVSGSASIAEAGDTTTASAAVRTTGAANISEEPDTVVGGYRQVTVASPIAIRSFTAAAASNRSVTATPASTRTLTGTSI